jgi:hypothetical protein
MSLRSYASLSKTPLVLIACLAFVLAAALILGHVRSPMNVIMALVAFVFFGGGGLVYLVVMASEIVRRRPVLEVDASGMTVRGSVRGTRHVAWVDIAELAVYKQALARGNKMYYLVANLRDSSQMESRLTHRLTASMYPSLSRAGITVPLGTIFVRQTDARCIALLKEICGRFSSELQQHQISVDWRVRLV